MLTISIYRGDHRLKAHVAFDGDLPQTVPELVFKADAGLVAFNSNRALRRALRRVGHRLYSRHQFLANAAIAASRVALSPFPQCDLSARGTPRLTP